MYRYKALAGILLLIIGIMLIIIGLCLDPTPQTYLRCY